MQLEINPLPNGGLTDCIDVAAAETDVARPRTVVARDLIPNDIEHDGYPLMLPVLLRHVVILYAGLLITHWI
jgi:hypothetical protein